MLAPLVVHSAALSSRPMASLKQSRPRMSAPVSITDQHTVTILPNTDLDSETPARLLLGLWERAQPGAPNRAAPQECYDGFPCTLWSNVSVMEGDFFVRAEELHSITNACRCLARKQRTMAFKKSGPARSTAIQAGDVAAVQYWTFYGKPKGGTKTHRLRVYQVVYDDDKRPAMNVMLLSLRKNEPAENAGTGSASALAPALPAAAATPRKRAGSAGRAAVDSGRRVRAASAAADADMPVMSSRATSRLGSDSGADSDQEEEVENDGEDEEELKGIWAKGEGAGTPTGEGAKTAPRAKGRTPGALDADTESLLFGRGASRPGPAVGASASAPDWCQCSRPGRPASAAAAVRPRLRLARSPIHARSAGAAGAGQQQAQQDSRHLLTSFTPIRRGVSAQLFPEEPTTHASEASQAEVSQHQQQATGSATSFPLAAGAAANGSAVRARAHSDTAATSRSRSLSFGSYGGLPCLSSTGSTGALTSLSSTGGPQQPPIRGLQLPAGPLFSPHKALRSGHRSSLHGSLGGLDESVGEQFGHGRVSDAHAHLTGFPALHGLGALAGSADLSLFGGCSSTGAGLGVGMDMRIALALGELDQSYPVLDSVDEATQGGQPEEALYASSQGAGGGAPTTTTTASSLVHLLRQTPVSPPPSPLSFAMGRSLPTQRGHFPAGLHDHHHGDDGQQVIGEDIPLWQLNTAGMGLRAGMRRHDSLDSASGSGSATSAYLQGEGEGEGDELESSTEFPPERLTTSFPMVAPAARAFFKTGLHYSHSTASTLSGSSGSVTFQPVPATPYRDSTGSRTETPSVVQVAGELTDLVLGLGTGATGAAVPSPGRPNGKPMGGSAAALPRGPLMPVHGTSLDAAVGQVGQVGVGHRVSAFVHKNANGSAAEQPPPGLLGRTSHHLLALPPAASRDEALNHSFEMLLCSQPSGVGSQGSQGQEHHDEWAPLSAAGVSSLPLASSSQLSQPMLMGDSLDLA